MKKTVNFILYNNTFIFIIGGIILGAGTTLAANEGVREQVVGTLVTEQTTMVSVDNQFLLTADIEDYAVTTEVVSIKEDAAFYYVEYALNTIVVADGLWQPGVKTDVFQLEKARLGNQDLGLYLAQEFEELITAEKQGLFAAQSEELQIGLSQKVAVTEYAGLVGRLMDSSTKVFPGYEPVIPQPTAIVAEPSPTGSAQEVVSSAQSPKSATTASQPVSQPDGESEESATSSDSVQSETEGAAIVVATPVATASSTIASASSTAASSSSGAIDQSATSTHAAASSSEQIGESEEAQPSDVTAPVLTLQGESSLLVSVGEVYQESGATAVDETDGDITAAIQRTGLVDTQTVGRYVLTYEVVDRAGNSAQVERHIEVQATVTPEPEPVTPKQQTASTT